MASGGRYGTEEELARFDAALAPIDPTIAASAARRTLSVRKNERESIGRSIRWGNDPSALLQLYLSDPERLTWNLWACCFEDRDGERYWKTAYLVKDKEVSAFASSLEALLERGFHELTEWREHPELLSFATEIAPLPDL